MTTTPSGWYSDPKGAYLYRYWDGTLWTDRVSNGGAHSGSDPNPLSDDMVGVPPAPGTAAPRTTSEPPPTVQVTQSSGSSFGTILGVVLAVIAIVIVIAVLANNSGDGTAPSETNPPVTTEAPPATTSE